VSDDEEAAFERARIAAQIQDLVRALVKDCPEDQQIDACAPAEASIMVALWGPDEVPRAVVEFAASWWKERAHPANRERSRVDGTAAVTFFPQPSGDLQCS
jgi:hypothetical protein